MIIIIILTIAIVTGFVVEDDGCAPFLAAFVGLAISLGVSLFAILFISAIAGSAETKTSYQLTKMSNGSYVIYNSIDNGDTYRWQEAGQPDSNIISENPAYVTLNKTSGPAEVVHIHENNRNFWLGAWNLKSDVYEVYIPDSGAVFTFN